MRRASARCARGRAGRWADDEVDPGEPQKVSIAVICQTGPWPVQAADEEAVDADQLARTVAVDVRSGSGSRGGS